jgi:hypothetical protein
VNLTFFYPLQVMRVTIKNVGPERPLSTLFTSTTCKFTSIPHTSLSSFNLAWESEARPSCCYISFHK